MDEPKTTPAPTPEPSTTAGRALLEQAFARGSGDLPVAPERTEHSVMEGLPPAKAERIAAMRRELADLQRQLIDAQQRVATELQGRAEDAERLETLETRAHAQEIKAQEDAARAAALATEIATLKAQLEEAGRQHRDELEAQRVAIGEVKTELEARTGERDTERAARARLESELADHRTQHDEVKGQLEDQRTQRGALARQLEVHLEDQRKQEAAVALQVESLSAALRDANALVATRDAELAASTAEREALARDLAAARAKMRDAGAHLARLGQELVDDAGIGPAPPVEPAPPAAAPKVEPPPTVVARVEAAPAAPAPPRPAPQPAKEAPASRSGALLIGCMILACAATFAVVKWRGASSADARPAPPPSPPVASEPQPAPPSITPVASVGPTDNAPRASLEPAPIAETAAVPAQPTAPAETTTQGVIVLSDVQAAHRLFVDGKVVPVKSARAVVACGTREVRVGSQGPSQTLAIACGGETTVPATREP